MADGDEGRVMKARKPMGGMSHMSCHTCGCPKDCGGGAGGGGRGGVRGGITAKTTQ